MRSVPTFLKGAFRGALVLAMDEALAIWTNRGAGLETLHVVATLARTVPPEVVWSRSPNSGNVSRNLPQASGTVCWRKERVKRS